EKRTLRSKVCFPPESGHSHGKLRRSVYSHKRKSATGVGGALAGHGQGRFAARCVGGGYGPKSARDIGA
ncbi:MAG: hypothetical protein V3S55_12835, partial [Nitrospiraceae bacterium]